MREVGWRLAGKRGWMLLQHGQMVEGGQRWQRAQGREMDGMVGSWWWLKKDILCVGIRLWWVVVLDGPSRWIWSLGRMAAGGRTMGNCEDGGLTDEYVEETMAFWVDQIDALFNVTIRKGDILFHYPRKSCVVVGDRESWYNEIIRLGKMLLCSEVQDGNYIASHLRSVLNVLHVSST